MIRALLITAFLLLTPCMSFAQDETNTPILKPKDPERADGTAIKNSVANKIYDECTQDPFKFQDIDPVSRGYMCACLSTGYQANLTQEKYDAMKKFADMEGRKVYEESITSIYFPCALKNIRDILIKDCTRRATISNANVDSRTNCACLIRNMDRFINKSGAAVVMMEALRAGQYVEPFDALVYSGQYVDKVSQSYYQCFNGRIP